jgi:hypothetical protein
VAAIRTTIAGFLTTSASSARITRHASLGRGGAVPD